MLTTLWDKVANEPAELAKVKAELTTIVEG